MTSKKIDHDYIRETGEKVSNWGRWGKDDEVGTLNHISSEDIVGAASLIRKGKVFSLALPFDDNGPQAGLFGNRNNPVHTMLATGTDAIAGNQDESVGLRYADDMISLPTQCGTQWDALSHIFLDDKMWNGYDAALVDSNGAAKNGIEKTKDKMVGRGVLLDIARYKDVDCLEEGYIITNEDLSGCAEQQGVEIRRGDFVLFRTGHMDRCLKEGVWGGYAGGDAPGLGFETAEWISEKEIAAICADTWGCEVRPNESIEGISQPWHWIVIPKIGISMGEIFDMKELAEDCANDRVYEFFFTAPPLPITGGTGSPINPLAIK